MFFRPACDTCALPPIINIEVSFPMDGGGGAFGAFFLKREEIQTSRHQRYFVKYLIGLIIYVFEALDFKKCP